MTSVERISNDEIQKPAGFERLFVISYLDLFRHSSLDIRIFCRTSLPLWTLCALAFLSAVTPSLGEDRTQPSIESFIGGCAFSGDHSYMAESRVQVPFLCLEPVRLT